MPSYSQFFSSRMHIKRRISAKPLYIQMLGTDRFLWYSTKMTCKICRKVMIFEFTRLAIQPENLWNQLWSSNVCQFVRRLEHRKNPWWSFSWTWIMALLIANQTHLPFSSSGSAELKDSSISSSERPFVSTMKYLANNAAKRETPPKAAYTGATPNLSTSSRKYKPTRKLKTCDKLMAQYGNFIVMTQYSTHMIICMNLQYIVRTRYSNHMIICMILQLSETICWSWLDFKLKLMLQI